MRRPHGANLKWGLLLGHGPSWRRQWLELRFESSAECLRWARGLSELLLASSLGIPRDIKDFLIAMWRRADHDNSNTIGTDELGELMSYLNISLSDSAKMLLQRQYATHA